MPRVIHKIEPEVHKVRFSNQINQSSAMLGLHRERLFIDIYRSVLNDGQMMQATLTEFELRERRGAICTSLYVLRLV